MRRRAGLKRDGPYWLFPQDLPEEWMPLSARYPEFFPTPLNYGEPGWDMKALRRMAVYGSVDIYVDMPPKETK